MIFLADIMGHLKTINTHKILVMKGCFKVGLYKQGLLHDLSKYSLIEFISGCRYYQGTRSPNVAERELFGYSKAWLHHKGRNKHHFEYWIDYGLNPDDGLIGNKMPVNYVVEMFIDRICACKVYYGKDYNNSSALNYFNKNRKHYVIHKDTEKLLEHLLMYYEKNGEERTFKYIKHKILKKKY